MKDRRPSLIPLRPGPDNPLGFWKAIGLGLLIIAGFCVLAYLKVNQP